MKDEVANKMIPTARVIPVSSDMYTCGQRGVLFFSPYCEIIQYYLMYCMVKGQCHEMFDFHLFAQKSLHGPHMNTEQAQAVSRTFSFSRRYSFTELKIACPCSQRLHRQTILA